jgi:hypothetical protein
VAVKLIKEMELKDFGFMVGFDALVHRGDLPRPASA